MEAESTIARKIAEFSLRRKVTILMLFVTLLVLGVIATLGLPVELAPRGFEAPFLRVSVPWRDAPAPEVLDKITLPLEEQLSTVKGLDRINSWSGTGNANVFLVFKQGVDMDVAYREVRDRLQRARLVFPGDVDRSYIYKDDPSSIPVAMIGMSMDASLGDPYDLIEKEVILPLSRLDGVASVTVRGMLEKEVLIDVNRELADGHGVNIFQVGQELQGDNFTLASGFVRNSGKKYLLRSVSSYTDVEELQNRVVNRGGVRIKDVAEVKYEEPERKFGVRVNGNPAVAVMVSKEGEANAVEVSKRIGEEVERMLSNPRLSAVDMEMIFSQGQIVSESVGNLIQSGRIGGVFAALVLFVFLRRFRITAIITLSIPLSILVALIAMYFMGLTLNILTMLALVICVGLLVDNSVVVAENIHRLHKEGVPLREACVKGAAEIALAITMATLTTIIVFLPSSLVEGQGQFFLIRLATPVCVALAASLIVALVFIPLSVYLTMGHTLVGERTRWGRSQTRLNQILTTLYEQVFGRINRVYGHVLSFFMQRRIDLIFLLLFVFGLTYLIAFKNIDFTEAQEEDRTGFRFDVEIDRGIGFNEVKEQFLEFEKVVAQAKRDYDLKGYLVVFQRREGYLECWLKEGRKDTREAKDYAAEIVKKFPKKVGFNIRYGRDESQFEDVKGDERYGFYLEGEDAEILDEVAKQLEPVILNVPGVLGIQKGNDDAPSEIALVVDRDRATASNVNPDYIAGVVGVALRGQSLPRYHDNGREVPVRVRYREEDRLGLADLNSFMIPTMDQTNFLSVASLTKAEALASPNGIFRRDKKVSRSISVELVPKQAEMARLYLDALKSSVDLPEGVRFDSEVVFWASDDVKNMQFAAGLSVLFIYLLMAFLFESLILPLSIILTIPLAVIGVAWIHYFAGMNVDFLGIVGMILLIGVVVNNGIVLIDYVNRLREQGSERGAAILRAADLRFRPIIMTALTTIIGMIPLAVSPPNDMGFSYKSFGLTLIGGMTTATVLTLLVVPVFYSFFDDARIRVSRTVGNVLGDRSKTADFQAQKMISES